MTPEPQVSLSSHFFQHFVAVLRARGLALIGVTLLASSAARGLDDLFHFHWGLQDHPENLPLVLTSLTLLSLIELLGLSARLSLISQALLPLRPMPDRTEFSLIMIESLRSLAAVLWRIPLLILPALWELVRLVPVPYIVMFDSAYRRGEVDVLKASRSFFRRHRLFVVFMGFMTIFHTVLLLALEPKLDLAPIWETPLDFVPSMIAISLLTTTVEITFSLLFRVRIDREVHA